VNSEAVYLDTVSADGEEAVIVRLCRYPADGVAWLWAHVFEQGRVCAFTQHDLACDVGATPIHGDRARYGIDADHGRATFERSGPAAAPRAASVYGAFEMHDSRHAPHGGGPILVEIDARFVPAGVSVSNLPGRSETLGRVEAHVRMGARAWHIRGAGQFHEQLQSTPRFEEPFVYGTLRGAAGCVFVRGMGGARGFWIESGRQVAVERVELSPPGSVRTIVLHCADGLRQGALRVTYDYTIPIDARRRPGTIVVGEIGGIEMSGCLNDYLVDRIDYERI